jgi:serine/threonine protein kinase
LRLAMPDPKTARNEVRAIQKLCKGTHKHIIKVFELGELPDSTHAFIDMELCSLNLDQYNKSIRMTILVHPTASNMRIAEIWSIIAQVADALAFIHKQHEIHRDLKPQNGPFSIVFDSLMISSILECLRGMEGCGFWPHF